MAKSGIHIKPSKRGTFTAAAKRRGKGVQGFASQVLANKGNYSPAMVKKANFARNAAKWKKELGGFLDQELNTPIIEDTPIDQSIVAPTVFARGGDLSDLKYVGNTQPSGIFGKVAELAGTGIGMGLNIRNQANQFNPASTDETLKQTMLEDITGNLGEQDQGAEDWMGDLGGFNVPTPEQLPPRNQYGGYIGLPEYSFGSWLGDNAGGILKGAGAVAMAIPAIGPVVGGVMMGAGAATDAIVGKVREGKAEAAQGLRGQMDVRNAAYRGRIEGNRPAYGSTFQDGGALMGQLGGNQNPVINEYNGGSNTHQQGVGGVPVDAKGNPSAVSRQSAVGLTEKGEVTWNGYVFSDKLKV